MIQTPEAEIYLTTLDPQSIVAYHGGTSSVEVTLTRTWLCPGYTGKRKDYCAPPEELILQGTNP